MDSLARARFLLVTFFVFALPLVIYLPNTSYTYTKAVFALFMVSFLLILWIAEMVLHKGYILHATPLFLPLLALVGAAALSIVNSQSLVVSLSSLALFIYFAAFCLLLANTIENLRQWATLLGCLLAAGSLVAVYALLQYWRVLPGPPGASGSEVIISTLGNKNYVAEFLSFLFIPGLIPLFQGKNLLSRLLALAGLGLILAVLLVAGSRGAWLALVISLLFFAIGIVGFRLTGVIRQNRRWLWALLGLGLAVLFALAWAEVVLPPSSVPAASPPGSTSSALNLDSALGNSSTSGLIVQADNDDDNESLPQGSQGPSEQQVREQRSILLRIWSWWAGWEMLKDRLFLGIGLGNYKLKFLAYKAKLLETERGRQISGFYIPRSAQAHNEYFQIAAEMGGLGLLALAWVLWTILRGIGQIRSSSPQEEFLYLGLFGGVIAFLAISGISFPLHRPTSALVLTVLLGLLYAKGFSSKPGKTFASAVTLRRPGITALVASILVVTAVVGVAAYRDFRANLYLEAGRWDLQRGRLLEAKEKLERGSRLAFQPAASLFHLGEANWELGDYQRAAHYLKRSLSGRVTESTYLLLAQAYAQLKDNEKAWEYLHQLLATEPHPSQKVQAYYLRAQLFRGRGDPKTALAQLEHVIQQASGLLQAKAYVLTAQIHLEQGDPGSARASYLQGLDVAEARLQQKKAALKEWLAGQGLPFAQYAQLAAEIDQLKDQVQEIRAALEALSSPR